MIQVNLGTLALDARGQPVVVLRPLDQLPGHGNVLPIWIGTQEATAILIAVEGTEAPRPMSYDLMVRLLDALGGAVQRIEVTKIEEGTFHATITLQTPEGVRLIDARPSDSIALAVRVGAPMFVAADVLQDAGIPDWTEEQPPHADEDEQVAAFQDFLDQVDPDDFRG